MRTPFLLVFGAAAAAVAAPLNAQAWIGGVVGDLMNRGDMKWCYDGSAKHNPKLFAEQTPQADRAMAKYLGLARAGGDLGKMFMGTREHRVMLIDGVRVDPATARDPWAAEIARLDPLGYILSNDTQNIHGHWRAVSSNGTTLGTYDVLLRAGVGGYHIRHVTLLSAGLAMQTDELKPFCIEPGDVEEWQAAKAQRDAEKAARAAGQR
jgi:hypothetical protein